jgi:hypothetical protein
MFREKTARRAGFSLSELAVVLIIMIIVVGFVAMCLQKLRPVREVAVMVQTANQLKQITLAVHMCQDVYHRVPPAYDKFGRMLLGAPAQVHLAPFCEQDDFYERYFAAEGKGEVTQLIVPTYLFPGDYSRANAGEGVQNLAANLRVFSDKGRNTAFDANMPALAAIEPLTLYSRLDLRGILDGTSNTLAFTTRLAECRDGGSRYAAPPDSKFAPFFGQNAATAPASRNDVAATFQLASDRFDCRPTPLMGQSFDSMGITVSLLDGSIRQVSRAISPLTWNLVVQPNDGMKLGTDWDQ